MIPTDFGLECQNAIKLQSIFNGAYESIEDGAIVCFKIGGEQVFYADFSSGRGKYFTVAKYCTIKFNPIPIHSFVLNLTIEFN